MSTVSLGKLGEDFAENFLAAQNYQILKRNFRCRSGEIDIIAFDLKQKQLVFIEVKTRTSDEFGSPNDALTNKKKRKLTKTAQYFINSLRKNRVIIWRIDVIGIKLDKINRLKNITHLKNILNG